jgi:hypothetical protein
VAAAGIFAWVAIHEAVVHIAEVAGSFCGPSFRVARVAFALFAGLFLFPFVA